MVQQKQELARATDAAYTYLAHNPDDEVAKSNYDWYLLEMLKSDPDFQPTDKERSVSVILETSIFKKNLFRFM